MQKKDQNYIKKENKGLVLDLIKRLGPVSRAKIAKVTKMSPTTVSRIVSSLIELNFVEETEQFTSGVGRKATLLAVKSDSILSIGIELDEKVSRACIIDFLGNMICSSETSLNKEDAPEKIVIHLKKQVEELVNGHNVQWQKVIGMGVGLPGLIDYANGQVKISAQLGWGDVPLAHMLEKEFQVKVFIDNELKLKAYAEKRLGNGKQSGRLVMIGFGSGVGSSLIVNGEIDRGHSNFAGEIGHTIVDPNGKLCPCGNFGCLQTYIAESFLLEEASKRKEIKDIQELIEIAERNEEWAISVIERAVTYATLAINNIVCINNPDTVLLTGSLIDRYPYITNKILKSCETKIWEPLRNSFALRVSTLEQQGVMLGAGMIAQKDFVQKLNFEEGVLN
ncbi:transcriptional regulator [Pullulanibacillus camelliae]|uniref:Transcriptional regulator n=1 Tax=Pullulanibacillus camelliae TaxID=1707096 RepID=A0A8J2VHT3_9BACL|nr:ROK family transcriptional regulator [Pullulanibacillus camelliae]GGE27450.1 transcriptional regulator [Pullulanibacillus camelliae]